MLLRPLDSPTPGSAALAAGDRHSVLIVDDNVDSAATMSMFLEMQGFATRLAYDGLEAVSAANAFHPDAIVMDIGMPGMSGHEAARAIRREPWAARAVLVALSGWCQDADRQRSLDAGFDHHLVKPVDHAHLMRILGLAARAVDP